MAMLGVSQELVTVRTKSWSYVVVLTTVWNTILYTPASAAVGSATVTRPVAASMLTRVCAGVDEKIDIEVGLSQVRALWHK